jgi:hypothetical protein
MGDPVGHGHSPKDLAQDRSQHCTCGGAHVAEQLAAFATHGPLRQRIEREGGQEHWSSDATHLESQHCSWPDGHCWHMSRDAAHAPVSGHTTGKDDGHASKQVVEEFRQRGALAAHCAMTVIAEQGILMHDIVDEL